MSFNVKRVAFDREYAKAVTAARRPGAETVQQLVADLLADPDRQDIDPALSPLRDFIRTQLQNSAPLNWLTNPPEVWRQMSDPELLSRTALEQFLDAPQVRFSGEPLSRDLQTACLEFLIQSVAARSPADERPSAENFLVVEAVVRPTELPNALDVYFQCLYQRADGSLLPLTAGVIVSAEDPVDRDQKR